MITTNKISKASQFKVRYALCSGSGFIVKEKTFKTIKVLEQWIGRNDDFSTLMLNRYAFIDKKWEAFTTIGKKTITLSEIKKIVRELEDEDLKPSKNEK